MKDTKGPAFTGRGTAIEALRMMQDTDCWGFTDLPMESRQECRRHLDGAIHAVMAEWHKQQEAYEAAWDRYLDLRKQVRAATDDEEKGLLISQAMALATRWGFEPPKDASPWRDVATDPPPTDGTKVLAVWGILPEITWYNANDGGWQSDNTGSPSYWMPLPEVVK